MKIKTVQKNYAPTLNRRARRQLAKKIRNDLKIEQSRSKKGKAEPLDSADDGRKSV